jgi:hypothetical protein
MLPNTLNTDPAIGAGQLPLKRPGPMGPSPMQPTGAAPQAPIGPLPKPPMGGVMGGRLPPLGPGALSGPGMDQDAMLRTALLKQMQGV